MFALVFYDVPQHRTQAYKQALQRHLTHTQNSVFSGTLAPSRMQTLKKNLAQLFEPGDAVCVMEVANRHNLVRWDMGMDGRGTPTFVRQADHSGDSQVC